MTLQERKEILQQRLNNMTAQKVQIEQALAQTTQAIQQLIGALQTVEEMLNDGQPNTPGVDVAAGEPVGSNSADPHVAE